MVVFLHFFNCTNGAKLRKASHIISFQTKFPLYFNDPQCFAAVAEAAAGGFL